MSARLLPRSALAGEVEDAARALLGALLVRELEPGPVVCRIVEVEAYDEEDAASHSARGHTVRNASMFLGAGHLYVYRVYGIHWCANVVAGADGSGAAVLLRAAEVVDGSGIVRQLRPSADGDRGLLRGPGRLTAGLAIDGELDGSDLVSPRGPMRVCVARGWPVEPGRIACGPRVGVTREPDRMRRFWLPDSSSVSPYRRSPRAGREHTRVRGGEEQDGS